jgi:hypothetical protein
MNELMMFLMHDGDHGMPSYDEVVDFFMDKWNLDLSEVDFDYMTDIEDPMNMSDDQLNEAMRILDVTTEEDF